MEIHLAVDCLHFTPSYSLGPGKIIPDTLSQNMDVACAFHHILGQFTRGKKWRLWQFLWEIFFIFDRGLTRPPSRIIPGIFRCLALIFNRGPWWVKGVWKISIFMDFWEIRGIFQFLNAPLLAMNPPQKLHRYIIKNRRRSSFDWAIIRFRRM